MAPTRTVEYYAISFFASRTFWFNVVGIAVAVLSLTEVAEVIPPQYMGLYSAALGIGNMVLRIFTQRPVAMIAPNEVKAVEVKRLGPPHKTVTKP